MDGANEAVRDVGGANDIEDGANDGARGVDGPNDSAHGLDGADDGVRGVDGADDGARYGACGVDGADDGARGVDGADGGARSCSDKEDIQFSFSSSFSLLAEMSFVRRTEASPPLLPSLPLLRKLRKDEV